METDSTVPRFAVGYNRSLKLIRAKRARKILLACDADAGFRDAVLKEARGAGAEVDESFDALTLAKRFGIEVPCGIVTYYE